MKQYSRVTYEVRCQIAALLKTNLSIPQIASHLGFNKSTIYREIRRNSPQSKMIIPDHYLPSKAQLFSTARARLRIRKPLIQGTLREFIREKLTLGWSPEQIAGRFRLESKESYLSHQTIYRFIKQYGGFKQYLRFYKKTGIGRFGQRKNRRDNLMSIHQRPKSANHRTRFGHWERDGMYGANRKQLLVCLERKSRLIRLQKMSTTDSKEVAKLTENALINDKVLTITNDNGSEFRRPQYSKYPIYYCDPMRPNQRGSVENVIGTLRKFIKRTTNLDELSTEDIKKLEDKLNKTPRKMFDYQTPFEVYYRTKVALAM